MKKLLLLLLCVPLIFTTCKKEDDTLGTGNFLETQDGSVWNRIDSSLNFNQIGFYNSSYFFINKDTYNGSVICSLWSEGTTDLVDTIITKHTSTEFSFSVESITPAWGTIEIYNFTLDGNNLLKYEYSLTAMDGNSLAIGEGLFVRSSTETNLSCN